MSRSDRFHIAFAGPVMAYRILVETVGPTGPCVPYIALVAGLRAITTPRFPA